MDLSFNSILIDVETDGDPVDSKETHTDGDEDTSSDEEEYTSSDEDEDMESEDLSTIKEVTSEESSEEDDAQ